MNLLSRLAFDETEQDEAMEYEPVEEEGMEFEPNRYRFFFPRPQFLPYEVELGDPVNHASGLDAVGWYYDLVNNNIFDLMANKISSKVRMSRRWVRSDCKWIPA